MVADLLETDDLGGLGQVEGERANQVAVTGLAESVLKFIFRASSLLHGFTPHPLVAIGFRLFFKVHLENLNFISLFIERIGDSLGHDIGQDLSEGV
jgi:hypothetical protein